MRLVLHFVNFVFPLTRRVLVLKQSFLFLTQGHDLFVEYLCVVADRCRFFLYRLVHLDLSCLAGCDFSSGLSKGKRGSLKAEKGKSSG